MGLCCSKSSDTDGVRFAVQPVPSRPIVTCAPQIRPAQPPIRPRPSIPSQPPVGLQPPIVKRPSIPAQPSIVTRPSIPAQPSIRLPSPVRPPAIPSLSPFSLRPTIPAITTVKKQNGDEQETSQKERQSLLPSQLEIKRDDKMLLALSQGLQLPSMVSLGDAGVLKPVQEGTPGYYFVIEQFGNRKFQSTYQIIQIERVYNPYLSAQYALKKSHNAGTFNERYLFHGTGYKAAMAVAKYNFDWRLVENKRFGRGVSFANNPWYASHYSKRHRQAGTNYIMILAKVLVEPGHLRMGNERTVIPSIGHTTTNHSREVLVKYDDGTFYPEYVVHFKDRYFY